MAINLRTLLSKKEVSDFRYNNDTGLPYYPLEGYEVINIPAHGNSRWNNASTHSNPDDYHYTYYPDWTIPAGATDVIFEIWGGGGAGGGNCCCFAGPPGGAGAYAFKRLIGSEVVPGCKYQICVARMADRSNSCSGRRGCKSYVIGHNLTNFCAEGGHGGNGGYLRGCQNVGTGTITSRYGCGTCEMGCCAIFCGADFGAYGLPGSYRPVSDGGSSRCCNSMRFPYSGGLVNRYGGWIEVGHGCKDRDCGMEEQMRAAQQVGFGGTYCRAYVPGFPGSTAYNCDDSVYCGGPGFPGYARIAWK